MDLDLDFQKAIIWDCWLENAVGIESRGGRTYGLPVGGSSAAVEASILITPWSGTATTYQPLFTSGSTSIPSESVGKARTKQEDLY